MFFQGQVIYKSDKQIHCHKMLWPGTSVFKILYRYLVTVSPRGMQCPGLL